MVSSWSLWFLLAGAVLQPQEQPKPVQPPASDRVDLNNRVNVNALWQDGLQQYILAEPILTYRINANTAIIDGWSRAIGANLAQVDEPLQVHLGLKPQEGLLILSVDPNGSAAKAQLRTHDVLLGLPAQVEQPPKHLELTTIRGGQRHKVALELAATRQVWIGVHTADLDEAMRTQLSLPAGRGILVTEVIEKAPAQSAGLLKHDVVTGLADGTPVNTTDDFAKLVQASRGKTMQLQVIRHAKSMTIGVTPVERPQEQVQQMLPYDATVTRGLIWLNAINRQNQPDLSTWIYQPAVIDPTAVQPTAGKVDALQKQVEQLLKEVTALREAVQKQQSDAAPKK